MTAAGVAWFRHAGKCLFSRAATSFRCETGGLHRNLSCKVVRWYSHGPDDAWVLSPPSAVDGAGGRGRIVCITSGKGGVGKTTTAASFSFGLAQRGHKTCVVDFDMGLRNLDIHLGQERRVIFDLYHVLMGECTLHQALIRDKRQTETLSMLAASQTRDKDVLTRPAVERLLAALAQEFDHVVLDSPAGIESGAFHAMYFADDAIIVTNPELSSCRDADKMVGFVGSRSRRAELGAKPVSQSLVITRYDPQRVQADESLSVTDIQELLALRVLGVVPESKDILTCTNLGTPVITMGESSPAAASYMDMVDRFLGEEKELRFLQPKPTFPFGNLFS